MRYFQCFGIAIFVLGGTLLVAKGNPSLDGQSQQNQAGSPDRQDSPPSTLAADTTEQLLKVCSKSNPPPCAMPPRVISAPSPYFSGPARGKRFDGVCILSVNVEPDGNTSHIRVINSLGKDLDKRAIEAVKHWKFAPATLHGKPVPVQIAVEVAFHLD